MSWTKSLLTEEQRRELIQRQAAEIEQLKAALQGMLDEWEKLARYGSPMAKAANERVNAARRALKGMK
jgi:ribosome recycling factor